jgi:hypothetical protein
MTISRSPILKHQNKGAMMFDKIGDVMFGLVVVAGITTVVAHPNSARIVTSIGRAGANWTRAAIGN